ncbi:MAG: DUF4824 family protein [Vicinamibacterales bacterium]
MLPEPGALPAQLTLLTLAPLVALSGVEATSRRPHLRHLAPVLALLACGAAWAALVLAPRALDLPLSSLLLWPGVGFGIALGTSYGFRAVLTASLGVLAAAVASVFFVSGGTPWTLVFERLEPLTGSAFLLAAVAGRLGPAGVGVEAAARSTGLVLGAASLVALAVIPGTSLLPFEPDVAQSIYAFAMAAAVVAAVWLRRRTWSEEQGRLCTGGGDASRLIVAALVLLVSMGGLLGVAWWNRGGEPQRIVLTDRELVPSPAGRPGLGGLRLAFRWEARDDPQDAKVWLPDGRLNALGFSTDLMASAPEAPRFYGRGLPRNAWVAFELDGPAWQLIEQRRAVARGERTAGPSSASRLVPVDAGPDPEALRRRYAGQSVVVLPAVIEMRHASDPKRGASVWGRVARLVTAEVSVPAHLRERVGSRGYEVVLGVGRLGAVWVEDIRNRAKLTIADW